MTGVWWCDEEAGVNGYGLMDVSLTQNIAAYDEVDCKVMQEILAYLRANH